MLHIVFITGKAGVGKSTYALDLLEYYRQLNCNSVLLNIADFVKHCANEYFGWDGKKDKQGRDLLQSIGKLMRQYDRDIIINNAIDRIENKISIDYNFLDSDKELVIVIPDIRFDREIKEIDRYFEKEYREKYSSEVLLLTREYKSQLTQQQQLDSTELGVSDYLVDLEIDLDNN